MNIILLFASYIYKQATLNWPEGCIVNVSEFGLTIDVVRDSTFSLNIVGQEKNEGTQGKDVLFKFCH